MVKHGNRAASSACGAADVLEELGVELSLAPEQQQDVVERGGIGFLFAPLYHPALRHAAAARRELGIPTTFNFLGPLANPAQPVAQAVGVADARMAELMAGVFAGRGQQGLVVHGGDGLDELTTTTTSTRLGVRRRRRAAHRVRPGRPRAAARRTSADLRGSARPATPGWPARCLDGRPGPVRDIVLLNAAAALVAYDKPRADDLTGQLADALGRAAEAVDSGAARKTLDTWVEVTQSLHIL